jgi:hypothetical protein
MELSFPIVAVATLPGAIFVPPSGSSCHACHVTHDADATIIAMQATLHLMGDPAGAVRFPNIDRTLLAG